jgi:hypothetical protein
MEAVFFSETSTSIYQRTCCEKAKLQTESLTWITPLYFKTKRNVTVSRPVCPGVRRPSGTCDQFLFLLEISFRQLRVCNFVAPSLTRGRVCTGYFSAFLLQNRICYKQLLIRSDYSKRVLIFSHHILWHC